MIIREHCLPGAYRNLEGWIPLCTWPEDCLVQWGSSGVVFRDEERGGDYRTAFFEAFPTDPSTFIRGQGPDVAAAERDAFAQWRRFEACPGHDFERRHFTNGCGLCRHCGLFRSRIFEPLPEEGQPTFLSKVFTGDPEALQRILKAFEEDQSG